MNEYRSLFDLSGRTALVVGAASGIGEACAHALAAFGARLVCADVDLPGASGTADAIVAAAVERVGVLDGLVVTPSINVRRPLLDIDDEAFARVLDVNLTGTFRVLRAFGRGMSE